MNTTIDTITSHKNGVVIAVLKKRPIDPYSEDENTRGNHQLGIDPCTDILALFGIVNDSLAKIGVSPVDADSWSRLVTLCAAAWTEEVVAAFKAQSQQHNL